MVGTAVSLRTPPARVFENYILTRVVDPSVGLTDIPSSFFTQAPGPGFYTKDNPYDGAGAGGTDDATSNIVPIGFDFQIDGIIYKNWCANCNGWMVLVDPTNGSFDPTNVLDSSVWVNAGIMDVFSSQDVLLAPWFDDLRNSLSAPSQLLTSPFSYSTTKVSHISQGFEPTPIFLDATSYGISYYHDDRSTQGRRLIVRWASVSNYTEPSSVIRFEVVIYENGTIEYRYTPRLTMARPSIAYEGATVGIFMPNGTNRFRDFSVGLGYRVDARKEYIYGGYTYDVSYQDAPDPGNEDFGTKAPFTVCLLPYSNWPGLHSAGCVMTFSPPKNKRKVLPRKLNNVRDSQQTYPLVARTGDSRMGTSLVGFDDRLSPNYSMQTTGSTPVIVNYPSTLPRFFGGNGLGTLQRQDLFSGDFLVTGSVVKSAIDQYVDERPFDSVEPFNESSRHEQGPTTITDDFFASGSSPTHVSPGFDQPLRSKTHVRFTLPVNTQATMPAGNSSIYYYNIKTKSWETPSNSTYVLNNNGTVPPSPNPYAGGDLANPSVDVSEGRIVEDARGFGPTGNLVSSGSHNPTGNEQTDSVFGSAYVFNDIARVIGKEYPKSIRNNPQYSATDDETFTLPINSPFLIEKAVFEVPFQAGAGWFNDKTQCFLPLVTTGGDQTAVDFSGPALTVALFRQVKLGTGLNAPTMRDLIMTGTITHVNDNTSSVLISTFAPHRTSLLVRPVGFLAYAGPPGAVVDDHGANHFTGSVTVKSTALSAVSIDLIYRQSFDAVSSSLTGQGIVSLLTQSQTLLLASSPTYPKLDVCIGYVSPLGRGGTGFDQSGRCILGNEYVTWQGLTDQTAETVANPFYVGPHGLDAEQTAALNSPTYVATASAIIQMGSHFPSPYMVMPGDRLILSISKTRLHVFSQELKFSGSLHDVALSAGNVNVTLYGSQIAEGVEYHDTLNQSLGSNFVHEMIGAEPVIDQFEVAYKNEYSGSFSDDMMFGTLSSKLVLSYSSGNPIKFVAAQTVRDRKLSKLNARNAPSLTTSSADIEITPSKAFRLEQWWEMVGNVKTSQFVDSTERYWDSMMPSVKDCFAADGCGIFITQFGTLGNSQQIDTGVSGAISFNPGSTRMGWILMDYGIPSIIASGYGPLINMNWNKAFPFEPRYNNASRQVNVERSFVATYLYGGIPVIQRIPPTLVNGFAFGTTALETAMINFLGNILPSPGAVCWDWIVDVNLAGKNAFDYYVTGSSTRDDTARALFGFGDRNTYFTYTDASSQVLLGTNHAVDTRDVEGPHPNSTQFYDNNFFRVSPRIRGWKYGVHSGLPTYSKAYWRRGRFGQFRDMLEQRPFTKYYQITDTGRGGMQTRPGVQPAAVTVTFVDAASDRLTSPDNTWSSNLHLECTSSLPFFDGISTNRAEIDPTILNLHPNVIRHDVLGNIHIA